MGARYVAGAVTALNTMREGAPLRLVREPDNPHDRNAVLVTTADGQPLGHIDRGTARGVALAIDRGRRVRARYDGRYTVIVSWPTTSAREAM